MRLKVADRTPERRLEILLEKVDRTADCWLWLRARNQMGYGIVHFEGRVRLAHRLLYEMLVGPVPAGFELDHLCRVRACVRPEHLEVVTHRENMRRSESWAGQRARQTACVRGHAFDEENTLIRATDGARLCRACRRHHQRESVRRLRAA